MGQHWAVGDATYPSHDDAPDWRWERRGNEWVEVNRPQPIMFDILPKSDFAGAMKRKEDYPSDQHKFVDDYNHIFRGPVRLALSRRETDWKYRAEVMDKHQSGANRLLLWEMTEGFTKSWSCPEMGYVQHGEAA